MQLHILQRYIYIAQFKIAQTMYMIANYTLDSFPHLTVSIMMPKACLCGKKYVPTQSKCHSVQASTSTRKLDYCYHLIMCPLSIVLSKRVWKMVVVYM